jgi:hypothetical protein
MRNPTRNLLSMALLALVLCLAAGDARADLGTPELTVMQTLAAPISQGGYGWGATFGWDYTTNPCPTNGVNWNGVVCIRGHVQSIIADCGVQKLNAPIPQILGQLPELTLFEQRFCGMTGSPATFGTLTQLSSLRLSNNALSGTIPDTLATLTTNWNLFTLDLENNQFTGAIPDFLSSNYNIVRLAGNYLTSIPDSWTSFDRDISYNCYPSIPTTCETSVPYQNVCTPNRMACLAAMALTKVSGDGQWAPINTNLTNPLVVSVTDLSGNPLAGVNVTFSGPGIVSTTATSDANGQVSAVVQAGFLVGGATVTASVGSTPAITFGLTAGDTAACSSYLAVTSNAASGPGTLQDALADVCPGGTVDLTPIAGQTIALAAGAPSYNFNGRLYIATDVTIQGAGVTISGSSATRIFFVQNGNVAMNNLTLTNGVGQGGTSQFGGSGGGLGGAIFQNNGNLTLNGVILSGNQAAGGSPDMSGLAAGGGFGGGASSGDLGARQVPATAPAES